MTLTNAADLWANKLEVYADDVIKRNNTKITNLEAEIASGQLSEKSISKKNTEISKLKAENQLYQDTKNEIEVLRSSSQVYDVKTIEKNKNGDTNYNTDNNYFEIYLPSNSGVALAAHEFKHAYQFETGDYSISKWKNGIPFYDFNDEIEAYNRSALFGEVFSTYEIKTHPSYSRLQQGPSGISTHITDPILRDSPKALQSWANRYKCVFRWNGQTYVGTGF